MDLTRRDLLTTSLCALALMAKTTETGTPRSKRIFGKRTPHGVVHVEWNHIAVGDWILMSEWNEHGLAASQEAWIVRFAPSGENRDVASCLNLTLDEFWKCDSEEDIIAKRQRRCDKIVADDMNRRELEALRQQNRRLQLQLESLNKYQEDHA